MSRFCSLTNYEDAERGELKSLCRHGRKVTYWHRIEGRAAPKTLAPLPDKTSFMSDDLIYGMTLGHSKPRFEA